MCTPDEVYGQKVMFYLKFEEKGQQLLFPYAIKLLRIAIAIPVYATHIMQKQPVSKL